MPSKESASPMPRDAASVQPDGILRLVERLAALPMLGHHEPRERHAGAYMYSEELGIDNRVARARQPGRVLADVGDRAVRRARPPDKVSITRALTWRSTKKLVSRRVDAIDRRKVVLGTHHDWRRRLRARMPLARAIEQELTSAPLRRVSPRPCRRRCGAGGARQRHAGRHAIGASCAGRHRAGPPQPSGSRAAGARLPPCDRSAPRGGT